MTHVENSFLQIFLWERFNSIIRPIEFEEVPFLVMVVFLVMAQGLLKKKKSHPDMARAWK